MSWSGPRFRVNKTAFTVNCGAVIRDSVQYEYFTWSCLEVSYLPSTNVQIEYVDLMDDTATSRYSHARLKLLRVCRVHRPRPCVRLTPIPSNFSFWGSRFTSDIIWCAQRKGAIPVPLSSLCHTSRKSSSSSTRRSKNRKKDAAGNPTTL